MARADRSVPAWCGVVVNDAPHAPAQPLTQPNRTMLTLSLGADFGYIVALVVLFYLHQTVVLVFPVLGARRATKIKAPTLYPRDSEIAALKLTPVQVESYMRKQRAHQQNVEVTSVFLPLLIIAGLNPAGTMHAAIAGGIAFVLRLAGTLGYAFQISPLRSLGGLWHAPELYIVFLAGKFAYELLVSSNVVFRA